MWQRTEIGDSNRACGLCRSEDVVRVRCTEVRTGMARLNPRWRPVVRTYDRCRSCGAKHDATTQQRATGELQPV